MFPAGSTIPAANRRLYRARMRRILTVTALITVMSVSACGNDDPPAEPAAAPPASTAPTVAPSSAAPTTEPTTPPATTEPPQPKLGQTQQTDLGTATVYAVKFPVTAQDDVATQIRDKGMQFAVADIKVCSNGATNADGYGFDTSDFQLVDVDSRAYEFWNVQVGARSPNLSDTLGFGNENPRKGSCKRGWLTFQLPPKTKIASVEYSPYDGTPLTWQVR
jgi:hypothetical protein